HSVQVGRVYTHRLQVFLQLLRRLALIAELARELADVIRAELAVRHTTLLIPTEPTAGTLLVTLRVPAAHLPTLALLLPAALLARLTLLPVLPLALLATLTLALLATLAL